MKPAAFSWQPYLSAAAIVVFFVLWELAVRLLRVPSYLIPPPSEILAVMWRYKAILLRDTWVTAYEIILGFGVGALIGFTLAVAVVFSPVLERVVMPPAILTQVIPKLAIAPLFVVWFGVGLMPKVAITALMGVFPVLINSVTGLTLVDGRWLELMHSVSASKWHVFTKVRLPNCAPYLFVGLKVGMTLSVVGAIVGEWMGADRGLGFQIIMANANLHTSLLFAAMVLLSVLGIGLFGFVSLIEGWSLPAHRRVSIWDQPIA